MKAKEKAGPLEYSFIQLLKTIPKSTIPFVVEGYNCIFCSVEGRLYMQWDLWDEKEWMKFGDWDLSTQSQIYNWIKDEYTEHNK